MRRQWRSGVDGAFGEGGGLAPAAEDNSAFERGAWPLLAAFVGFSGRTPTRGPSPRLRLRARGEGQRPRSDSRRAVQAAAHHSFDAPVAQPPLRLLRRVEVLCRRRPPTGNPLVLPACRSPRSAARFNPCAAPAPHHPMCCAATRRGPEIRPPSWRRPRGAPAISPDCAGPLCFSPRDLHC